MKNNVSLFLFALLCCFAFSLLGNRGLLLQFQKVHNGHIRDKEFCNWMSAIRSANINEHSRHRCKCVSLSFSKPEKSCFICHQSKALCSISSNLSGFPFRTWSAERQSLANPALAAKLAANNMFRLQLVKFLSWRIAAIKSVWWYKLDSSLVQSVALGQQWQVGLWRKF
jgi:hypothetical protein